MNYKGLISILLLVMTSISFGQNSVTSSGENAIGSTGNVNYSVGQILYTTNYGSNGSVAQGVQQPYEISVLLGIDEAIGIDLLLSVFPNPTTDFVTLKFENYDFESIDYQLFDINGKIILTDKSQIKETKITIGNLPSSIYFLKVLDANKELKTFKIIKN